MTDALRDALLPGREREHQEHLMKEAQAGPAPRGHGGRRVSEVDGQLHRADGQGPREALVMPSRADMEAATPKCPAGPDKGRYAARGTTGVYATDPCREPMSYDSKHEQWVCSTHGSVAQRSLVASQEAAS